MRNSLFIILFGCTCFFADGKKLPVNTDAALTAAIKSAQPGDTIVMAAQEWKDVSINFYATGTSDKPIVLSAEIPGKTIITGNSKLVLFGEYLVVSGLWFKNGVTDGKPVISFRKSKEQNSHFCRVTECAITNYNPSDRSFQYQWVELWGKNNRVDHCSFAGKTHQGPTLIVGLKDNPDNVENNHRIDHNHFGYRPPLGTNGGETMRIGTSHTSMESSKTIVENNLFEKCNGEVEIISSKSCDNIYRNNLFIENEGILTLRHGNRCLVEGNIFYGNNKAHTGGVRVINEGHIVQNNIFIGLKGDGFRSPLVVMNGVPNSPLNRYNQVKDAWIQNNTFINCASVALAEGSDEERSLAPENTVFANNLFFSDSPVDLFKISDDISGIIFSGNKVHGPYSFTTGGVDKVELTWKNLSLYPIPTVASMPLIEVKTTKRPARTDITGTVKSKVIAGAVIPGNEKVPSAIATLSGVSWKINLSEESKPAKIEPSTVKVPNTPGALVKAVKSANDFTKLLLEEGTYHVEKGMVVSSNIEIIGAGAGKTIIAITPDVEKVPSYIFKLSGGKSFLLQGVTIDGESSESVKYGISSPSEATSLSYRLKLKNVHGKNFLAETGAFFKAYAGTFADTILMENCKIENCGRGLNLSYEKEDIGKYSAEVIDIKNTVFYNINEFAINYYRGGSDESTLGGQLNINHSVFYNVNNNEKGRVLKTDGIVYINITNSIFTDSPNASQLVSLKGDKNKMTNCVNYRSGKIRHDVTAIVDNILQGDPRLIDTETFMPKENSPVINAGTNGSNIGLMSIKQ